MKKFDYSAPYLYKDKDNKKWCVRYSITYKGEKTEHIKEYGKIYFGKSLNRIKDLKTREREFKLLISMITLDLEDGIDKRKPELVLAYLDNEAKKAKKCSYDECFNLYMKLKGLINPIPKKVISANTIGSFFNNQFKPFLINNGLDNDLNLVNKSKILEFLNYYYLSDDLRKKWNNTTYNNRKGILHGFFSTLLDEEKIKTNPVDGIKNKPSVTTKRFEVFSKTERDLVFKWLEKNNRFMLAVAHMLYYAYIRESELGRLKIKDMDLKKNRIRIVADNAKGQRDNLPRVINMPDELKASLLSYIKGYEDKEDFYIFGKSYTPGQITIKNHWHQKGFDKCLEALRIEHPKLFKSKGLTLYAMKHSGVTDFVNDNADELTYNKVFMYVQAQCRHSNFSTTEKYLRSLEIDIVLQQYFKFS